MAAVGANAVGKYRLVAAAAILDLQRLQVLMTPPFTLAGVGGSSLGNCHRFSALSEITQA
jgi:hypothetical protein